MPTILYLGDSHSVTSFGQNILQKLLTDYPDLEGSIHFYAVSGSCLMDWLQSNVHHYQIKNFVKTPFQLASLSEQALHFEWSSISQIQPDILILALGTNDIRTQQSTEAFSLLQIQLKSLRSVKKVIWIAPPLLQPPDILPAILQPPDLHPNHQNQNQNQNNNNNNNNNNNSLTADTIAQKTTTLITSNSDLILSIQSNSFIDLIDNQQFRANRSDGVHMLKEEALNFSNDIYPKIIKKIFHDT